MRVLVQRCRDAKVVVDGKITGQCKNGLLVFVGFTKNDDEKTIDYLVRKILHLRIFPDEFGIMNKSVLDVGGSILSVSQFTLYGDVRNGNRPSYIEALGGDEAKVLYDRFNVKLRESVPVETGVFGANMDVTLTNVGPTTIWLER